MAGSRATTSTSFAPLLTDPSRPWKSAAFSEFLSNKAINRAVVTERYRYAEWTYKGQLITELYDLQQDPWETVNLAGKPDEAAICAEMAARLKGGWKSALPARSD